MVICQTKRGLDTVITNALIVDYSGIYKADMNDATPVMEVDPATYEVRADGKFLKCEPAEVLPMAQRYFLF